MKTKFLLLLIASILVSCSNPLNISIVDELPDNVVSKYIAKDSLFDGFYKEVRLLVDTVYKKNNIHEIKHIKYSDLYSINQTFIRERKALSNDQNLSNWLLEYEKDIKQFDIDSLKYTDYISQNDYNNYLSIEPFKVYEKADWLGVNIPTLDMNIEPLNNNKIRKIVGFVSLVEKSQKEDIFSYSYSNGAFFSNSDTFQKNFKLIAQDHSSGNSGLSNVINLPIEVIKQKYNFHFKITDLVVNDKYVDVLLDSVPTTFLDYFQNKSIGYKNLYIKNEINNNFKEYNEFINGLIKNSLSEEDKQVLKFYEVGYEKYYKL